MTEEQASKVLQAASGRVTGYVKVVQASKGRYGDRNRGAGLRHQTAEGRAGNGNEH